MYTMCEQRPKVHKETAWDNHESNRYLSFCAPKHVHLNYAIPCLLHHALLYLFVLLTQTLYLFLTFLIEGYQETYRNSTQSRIFAKSDRNYLVMRATVDHFFLFLSLPLEKIEPKPNIFAVGTFRTGLIRTTLPYDP